MLLGLQLTPVPVGSGGASKSSTLDLATWPEKIRARLTNLIVHLGDVTPDGGVSATGSLGPVSTATRWTARAAAAADDLWYETFKDGVATALLTALEQDAVGGHSFSAQSGIAPLIDSDRLSAELMADYRERIVVEAEHGSMAAKQQAVQQARLRKWSPPGSARDQVGATIEGQEHREKLGRWRAALKSFKGSANVASVAKMDTNLDDFTIARARARNRALELDGRAVEGRAELLDHLSSTSQTDLDDVLEELAIATNVIAQGLRTQSSPTSEDTARRKLSSIITSPAIATFLGVNAELRVPRKLWEAKVGPLKAVSYGAVAVSFDASPPTGQGWTAFVHGGEGGPSFFGPCDEHEALARGPTTDAAIVGGVLRLRANKGSELRYKLDITDTVSSTKRRMDFARSTLASLRGGEAPAGNEPNPVGRGLTLIDTGMHAMMKESGARLRKLQEDPQHHVNFAADLLRGYGVMFAIPKQQAPSLKSRAAEWRTAVARSVSFRSRGQVDEDFVVECVSPEREFGLVDSIPVEQVTADASGNSQSAAVTAQEIFSWHGGSLSLALPTESTTTDVTIKVREDLAVPRTYHLPDMPGSGGFDYRPPPLRDGYGYLVGLTASYVGGWTLGVAAATAAHAEDRYGHVLGDPAGKPFAFRRPDKIPAPLLLLPHDSRMVTVRSEPDLLGESLQTLVVRTGDTKTSTSQRFFYPHAVDFDRAEQQDQFRGVQDDEPPGAFRSHVGVLWRKGGGSFPLAMKGGISTSPKANEANSRGQVLQFDEATKQKREYHPDGHSQYLRLHLAAQTPSNVAPPKMKLPVGFWKEGKRPRDAMPVLLEVRRTESNLRKPRIEIGYENAIVGGVDVRKIVISMQPATSLAALAVAEPSPEVIVRNHVVGEELTRHALRLSGTSGDPDKIAAILLAALLENQVVSTLNGAQAITLVHAQQRPGAPAFVDPSDPGAITPLLTTVAADSSNSPDRKWSDVVTDRWKRHGAGYAAWESEEGGATCFFVGCVNIDPAATEKLRCEAGWLEHGPEYLKRDQDRRYRYIAGSGHAQLFNVADIDSATTATRLDLLRDPLNPRRLAHAFPDGRARRLSATLIATSRFVNFFRNGADCESRSQPRDIWQPCTFRPPAPTIANVKFMLKEDRRCDGRGRYSFTRTSNIRLELGKDVFASGEGEALGVLFRKDGTDPCDLFTPALEPYADGFTLQGRNQLHQSPTRGNLPPDRFRSGDEWATGLLKADRPSGEPGDAGDSGVLVNIRPHVPVLDEKRGFYCDIVLDPQNAAQRASDLASGAPYMPFVHLGLARYQKHSVAGLELSHAVGRDLWLMPWRHGSIEFSDQHNFVIRVEGPMIDEDPETGPLLEISVVHNEAAGSGTYLWVPARGKADEIYKASLAPSANAGRAIWEWTGRLPHARLMRNYGIRFRERARIRDDVTKKVLERRWVLNTTIDLWSARSHLPVELVSPLR
ncbi:hypothetical protein [Dokdonella soli]|uniref:Uncharacterized protein n=1 Tax=Dokdonella soli TaxID=529810 RepID=A0ABP3U5D0_9GAMM